MTTRTNFNQLPINEQDQLVEDLYGEAYADLTVEESQYAASLGTAIGRFIQVHRPSYNSRVILVAVDSVRAELARFILNQPTVEIHQHNPKEKPQA